jgi:sortase A
VGGHAALAERALALVGITCMAWVCVVWTAASIYQARAKAGLSIASSSPGGVVSLDAPGPSSGHRLPPSDAAAGSETGAIGLIEIPRLELSVAVLEGDDERTLRMGVGHLRETPLPGRAGNTALAGHRDSWFRPLRHLQVGDDIRLSTSEGTFLYRVQRTLIVEPDDLSVLAQDGSTALTLITCYPFTYIGAAPRRFIVQATRVAS